jgi:transposase
MTTKIHAAVDALGNPVRLLLTAGQASEYGQANALIEGFDADHVIADGCSSFKVTRVYPHQATFGN